MQAPFSQIEIIAPNFNRRLSGVTSTIVHLIPLQWQKGQKIVTFGWGLPESLPKMSWLSLFGLWQRPERYAFRIWHARRNIEMLAGVLMRDVLRMPLRLVFTSASQRNHKSFTKWLIRRMNAVIATSVRSGRYLEVLHDVIMHGIDTKVFHPPEKAEDEFAASGFSGRYAVGCFGRIRHQKGTDLFVDAMIALLPKYPDWTAIIIGRTTAKHKSFESDLRNRITKAGLQNRICILGEMQMPDIKIWYRRLSLYVAPSRHEGFGLTPLEAMASQTAVVASDVGAYPEMISEGKNGSLVAAGNIKALCDAIEAYLADPQLAMCHGQAALEYVRIHFSLAKEADAITEVYKRIFEQNLRITHCY